MQKIAIVYAPMAGKTEIIANRLKELFPGVEIKLIPVKIADRDLLMAYDKIIFGMGHPNEEFDWNNPFNTWRLFLKQIEFLNFSGKKVALYCLGNQQANKKDFVSLMGEMAELISQRGGKLVGNFPNEGFDFQASDALNNENQASFCGLPLDEDTEPHLTQERLEKWKGILEDEMI